MGIFSSIFWTLLKVFGGNWPKSRDERTRNTVPAFATSDLKVGVPVYCEIYYNAMSLTTPPPLNRFKYAMEALCNLSLLIGWHPKSE